MEDDVKQAGADRYAVSQAYRWKTERDTAMQELRQLKDRSRDTTVSAYDLLPEEECDAIAWVREHGGLDIVKKLFDWVVGHCSTKQQLDCDFWLAGRVMYELGFDEDMADRDEVERRLLARLMPEGYEWPRYESGEPLRYEDRYVYDGREREVWHVDFDSYGEPTILNKDGTRCHPDKGERVKRPAVAEADGDGCCDPGTYRCQEVAFTCDSCGHTVFVDKCMVDEIRYLRAKGIRTLNCCCGHGEKAEPFIIVNEGDERRMLNMGYERRVNKYGVTYFTPKSACPPKVAADGKPLLDGDEVWRVKDGSGPYHVQEIRNGASVWVGETWLAFRPKELTHERPDSWERIEREIERGKTYTDVCVLSIVRRCRALAERERGE